MPRSAATRTLGILVASAVLTGTVLTAPSPASSSPARPEAAADAADSPVPSRVVRRLKDRAITESSGLARSTYARDLLFTHNDSGDRNRLFALDRKGRTRAVLRLRGAKAQDWEDISSGPRRTLWVGDIGDNARKRSRIVVHRITEPRRIPRGRTLTVPKRRYTFTYPDGPHDAEALLVHPRTGRLHVVTKSSSGGGVYRAPASLSRSRSNELTRVADAPALVTAGSFSPDGRTIVLGSYTHAYTYRQFGETPSVVRLPQRQQGESLEVDRRGRKVLLGSEGRRSRILAIALPRPGSGSGNAAPSPTGSCKAPAYSSSRTLFGTSLSSADGSLKEALAKNDALFGRLPVVRQFDPTVPPPGAWSRRTFLADRTLVVSFREHPADVLAGKHDAAILAHFRSAPRSKPIFWSYFHEPEPHVANGDFTLAQYRAAWRHVVDLVGTLCRDNLYPTLILTGWTTEPASKRSWRDYYPGGAHISVVAWDPYNFATTIPTLYKDPATLYASVVKASRESGKPWGIAETGSALVPGDDGTARAAWLDKVARYFRDKGAAWVTYFQSNRDNEFRLFDEPSRSTWAKWVRSSG